VSIRTIMPTLQLEGVTYLTSVQGTWNTLIIIMSMVLCYK